MTLQRILVATLMLATTGFAGKAMGQAVPSATRGPLLQQDTSPSPPAAVAPKNLQQQTSAASLVVKPTASSTPQPLFDFKESDIKFQLTSLMNILRDSRHESWVLAAYPDPKTSRPLIGAGFSLDVDATPHPQRDPLNPHPFVEPSSAQLWQAAGLDADRLQSILDQYDRDLDAWKKKNFRRKIRTHQLSPELTDEDAIKLLRISAIQAAYNARAYCRMFDQLTASQQMALSQLVFQMGVNLEEFTQFLSAINEDASYRDSTAAGIPADPEHWKMVQSTLIQSQWARRYSTRAISVIAMFDPQYDQDPREAERKVQAVLHPRSTHHHRKKAQVRSVRDGNGSGHVNHAPDKTAASRS